MVDDCRLVHAIGETEQKISESADFLIDTIAKLGEKDEHRDGDPIGTFVRPGPEGSRVPWMVLIGPAPVMCEHASESARETGLKLLKKMRELKELDEMEGDADE